MCAGGAKDAEVGRESGGFRGFCWIFREGPNGSPQKGYP